MAADEIIRSVWTCPEDQTVTPFWSNCGTADVFPTVSLYKKKWE